MTLHNRRAATVLAALAAAAPVVLLLALGWPRQVLYRTANGHPFGDVRPAVARLATPGYRELPVVVLPSPWYAVQALAYDPALTRRLTFTDGPRVADGQLVLTNSDRAEADIPDSRRLGADCRSRRRPAVRWPPGPQRPATPSSTSPPTPTGPSCG